MSDDFPTPAKGVYIYLDYIALGFVLVAVEELVRGGSLKVWAGCFVAGAVFLFIGVAGADPKGGPISAFRALSRSAQIALLSCLVICTAVSFDIYDRHRAVALPIPSAVLKDAVPSKTKFVLSIAGGNVFLPDQAKGLTGLSLNVSIRNTGHPSTANDWKLWIIPNNGVAPQQAQLTNMPETLSVNGPNNSFVARSSESLARR